MARIQLVTDVSQWGLMNWPARTRRRLQICTLVATVATVASAVGSAYFILEVSSSVLVNMALITANMFLMLVAAFLQAVFIGDLFFAGPWRERVFLGERPPADDDALDFTTVNDHNGEFIALIIVAILVNAVGLHFATGGFFQEYHDEGFFHVQMRSSNADQREAALVSISDPNNNRLWEREGLRDLIVDALEDEDPGVRRRAAFTAGSLQVLRARESLRERAREDGDVDVRAEAAFTLGKLGRDVASLEVLMELLDPEEPSEVRLGGLRGLAQMRDPRAVEAVVEQIDDEDREVMAYAFWALARIGSSEPREEVRAVIEEEPPGFRRCAAMEGYKLVAAAEDAMWARRQFQNADPEARCEGVTFEELDERIHYVVYGESERVKWLKTVGNTDPYEHRRWLRRLLADPEEEVHVRDVAAEILRQMDP